jgi:uncharacterized protein
MKTIVIYHNADFDGLFCREIARKFFRDADLIGWNYGDPTPSVPRDARLFILDLSIPDLMDHPKLTWIDHHKTAIDKYPSTIPGYRIDGVAACRLAWQWFHATSLPEKEDFIERKVSEPFAIRLAGEYDIWDKRDSRAELLQHGLRSCELTPEIWKELLDEKQTIGFAPMVQKLLFQGQAIQYAKTQENQGIISSYGFTMKFEGLTFLACNHARFNSLLFTAGLTPEHDACLGFNWTGSKWRVSLYHATGKEHHDLSKIASKYGGGGHRGACGFEMSWESFSKIITAK